MKDAHRIVQTLLLFLFVVDGIIEFPRTMTMTRKLRSIYPGSLFTFDSQIAAWYDLPR
jgi:hypothetical protein